jgi:hypothetical protein
MKQNTEENTVSESTMPEAEVHPVLAEVLKEEQTDTVSWVKG